MEPYFLPPEIWRYIFEFVAEDSRAYLIPLRRVCRAWKVLAQVVPAKFTCAMTRLLTVSARDCLLGLCNWAHEGGGVVGPGALIAAARTGNVNLVTLVHGWTDGLEIAGLNPEAMYKLTERQYASVFLTQTRTESLSPQRLEKVINWVDTSSIMADMLSVAAEVGSTETCRYLIAQGGVGDSGDSNVVGVFAAINDDVSMLRLCEETLSKSGFATMLKQLVVLAARNGSHAVLKIIEEGEFYDSLNYWKLVFLGAALGYQIALYDAAKSHLSPMWRHLSPIDDPWDGDGPVSLLGTSLERVAGDYSKEKRERAPMIRKLVEDGNGATLSRLARFARNNDPTLGPLVIELGGEFDLRVLEKWEALLEDMGREDVQEGMGREKKTPVGSRKRRRAIPFDLSGVGDPSYLSD